MLDSNDFGSTTREALGISGIFLRDHCRAGGPMDVKLTCHLPAWPCRRPGSAVLWKVTNMKQNHFTNQSLIGRLQQAEAGRPVKYA